MQPVMEITLKTTGQGAALAPRGGRSVSSWRLFLGALELALYGPLHIVSGWFADDPGYGGQDPLAREELLGRRERIAL